MKTLIIDDERLARQELKRMLNQFPQIEIIGESSNADDAIEKINAHNPDLIFLDIQMPDKSGFDMLQELESVPEVIFVTAYDEYALKAFEISALDYLLKPVEESRLEAAVERMSSRIEDRFERPVISQTERLGPESQIFIKDGEKCFFVALGDVRLFESEGNYVRVFFKDSKPLILRSLNALEQRLDEKTFFRANRKYIVNLKWIDKIENWFNGGLRITLKDGTEVEVSRRQASRFKDLLSL